MNRRILNLGAGTQSSVVAIMCDRGEFEPVEAAIFADTQAEPAEVYDHLKWLEKQLKNTPVVRVTAGNLEVSAIRFERNGHRNASVPLFVTNGDGSTGMIRRQCTSSFKIEPITRYIRTEILGLAKGEAYRGGDFVTQIFGISFDERERAKNGNGDPRWMKREYPLIDLKLTRQNVISMAEKWFPEHPFPRSACVFCPFKTNAEWRRLRDDHPSEWQRAVNFDHAQRDAKKHMRGQTFVHRDRVPLAEVDLRPRDERDGQMNIFGMVNECEGMCGV